MDTSNRNTALASALVEELGRCGVSDAVISPGSRSTPVALALDASDAITSTVIGDERAAGFFALGTALASGRPAVVSCTSGTAAANLHPAVAEASEAGVPIIVLTSDRPPELRGIGAGQTIDQIKLYGSAVRWFCEAGTHEADDAGLLHMRASACRAYAESLARPTAGPVHVNLSWRDPLGPAPIAGDVTATSPLALRGRGDAPLTSAAPFGARRPAPDLIEEVGAALSSTGRGLIIAGRQSDSSLPPALVELSAASGFPILAEPTSQLRFGPHDRSAVISTYDSIARAAPRRLEPAVVIRFGDIPTSRPLRDWLAACAPTEIVVDPPSRWNDPGRTASRLLRCDPAALALALAGRLRSPGPQWLRAWRDAEQGCVEATRAVLADISGPSEPLIHQALATAYESGDAVLLASSMPIRDHEAFALGTSADVYFAANRGANGIDGTVATGAGLAHATNRPTWVVLGDLALAHDLGGLATLGAASGALRLVVIDNGGGGIFDFLPQASEVAADRFERLFTTPSGLDLAKVADLFGLEYRPIESIAEIRALAAAPGKVLAHVRTDRGTNVDLHRRIADAVARSLQGPG